MQQVTVAGASTTNGIEVGGLAILQTSERLDLSSSGQIDFTPDTATPANKTTIQFTTPTSNNNITLQDGSGTVAFLSDITSGGSIPHATASGTDTYTATISGVTSYNDGDAYLIRFTNGNTSSATLNINSIGAVDLYRNNDGLLIGGDIISGGEMLCVYNSTTGRFQLIGTAPNTLLAYVTNADSVSITKGQVVYAFGGQGDRMTVKRANNSTEATSSRTVGVVLSTSIAANQKGIIIIQGLLDGLSILPTSTFADGDSLYLGSTAGSITNVKPSAPNNLVYLGVVTTANNGSSGRWYVKVQNGYELNELHDVAITSIANNQVLQYESATTLWKNKALTTASVAASTDKNYVTDAQAVVIGNTSGTNSGNETTTTIGTLINGATSKTTPVDADQVGLMDSAASNILKKLSWANIKATLKTYFDTLYQAAGTYLTASNNLSDLTNTTTARTNLGLDLLLPVLAETCTDGAIVGNGGTGTTNNTYTGGVLITPAMIAADTTIEVLAGFRKSAANGASTIRIYANTTNDIAGSPILIGQALYAAGVLYSAQSRQLRIKVKAGTGAGTEVLATSINSVFSDLSNMTVGASNIAIDWTTNKYIVVSLQLGVATATTGDSARLTFLKVRR